MNRQKQFIYTILIAAAVIALLLYNPWLLYFQNDDLIHIPLSKDGILFQRNSFRPICDISLILDYKLYGKYAAGYHFTNLLLHLFNSVLVFILAKFFVKKHLVQKETNLIAFITAVLFWIYMNHSEPVFWILGRSAMLGLLFFLPAVIFYFNRSSAIGFSLSIIFSALAWLSYESTLILPAIFFAISFFEVKSKKSAWRIERKFLIAIALAFIVYCCCRIYFIGETNYYNVGSKENINLSFIAGSFSRLIIRSWLPPLQNKILLIVSFLSILILLITLILKPRTNKSQDVVIVLLLLWLISLFPYVMLSVDTKGVESERFLYLPSVFICLIISILITRYNWVLQTIAVIIIFCINIIVLTKHANQYRFAGRVVSSTVGAVNQLKQKRILYVDSLPQENFGALIFRSGFIEGISWLKNKNTVDSIVVISQKTTDLPLQKNYNVIFSRNLSLISDSVKNKFSTGDVYFLYTDSALTVITKP